MTYNVLNPLNWSCASAFVGKSNSARASDSTINISMIAVIGTDTLISNAVSGTFSQTSAVITSDGFLSDGTSQLDFGMNIVATETSATISFSISHSGLTIGFVLDGGDTGGGSAVVTFTDSDGNTIVITFEADDNDNIAAGSGITFNGTQVAVISGTLDDATITNAEGDPLTAAEITALLGLFDAMIDVFDFFMGMFEFTFVLILLGAIS